MKQSLQMLIIIALAVGCSNLLQAQQRPNIVVFLVDDMGWVDTSVPLADSAMPFNKLYHTPNMERLASEGLRFTNAYATPVCTPSRISMMTGMNAARHGVTNWTSPQKNTSTDRNDDQFVPPLWNINGLTNNDKTPRAIRATPLPGILKDAGYFTIHVGKAHWGPAGTPGSNPHNLGFLINIAGHAAGHPQSYLGKENYGNLAGRTSAQAVPGLQEYHGTDTFLTEALTLEAIKALEAPIQNSQPFFLHISHYAVHDPIQADKRFVQKYLDAGLLPAEASYASLLEGMDKSLGDLMDYFKARDVEKNTVILFMSDNGGLSYVPPRGGRVNTHNWPLKSGKGSIYEGGIRVPMLMKWPGKLKHNAIVSEPVIIEDFFPTILEIAGVKPDSLIQETDGKSFMPLTATPAKPQDNRFFIWHIPNKWQPEDGPGINYKSAIRQGHWKLIYNMRDGSKELYNLQQDIGENNNLAMGNPEKVRSLSVLLGRQLQQWNAPMPVLKSSGKPISFPHRQFVKP